MPPEKPKNANGKEKAQNEPIDHGAIAGNARQTTQPGKQRIRNCRLDDHIGQSRVPPRLPRQSSSGSQGARKACPRGSKEPDGERYGRLD